jgi:hypothetical protein
MMFSADAIRRVQGRIQTLLMRVKPPYLGGGARRAG